MIGTKGKDYPRRADNRVPQIIIEPSMAHSKKPDTARDRIVKLMGETVRKPEMM